MLYITQRTNRHIVKKLSTTSLPAVYVSHFGTFEVKGSGLTTFDNPWGVTHDTSNNIYVCDFENQRITKFDSSLAYITSYDTRTAGDSAIGNPCAILFDITTGNLYVAGVFDDAYVRIQRFTTSLTSVRISGNLNTAGQMWFRPTGICRGFISGRLLVAGCNLGLFQTIETSSFSSFTTENIVGETTSWPQLFTTTTYNSVIKHSNGNVYVNNGRQILRVSNTSPTMTNIGDSNVISNSLISGLKEGTGGSILTYLNDKQKIIRFNENMNFLGDVYWTTGVTVDSDAYDVVDFTEI
jgi:hypothetical protein